MPETTNISEFGKYGLSLINEIVSQLNWSVENKKQYITDITNTFGYDVCCNLFKKGNSLSFKDKKQIIRNEVLENPDIILSHKQRMGDDGLMFKVYHCCFNTNSAFFMTFIFNIIFSFKYRFYSLFIKLLPIYKKMT